MAQQQTPIIFIMGPTASGKTGLAVDLRKQLNGDIISVDSALVYRGMDIGTAKPDADTLKEAPHRLINLCDPSKNYDAAQFRTDALREIKDIHKAGKLPLLVGGTGLYFRALEKGLAPLPTANNEVRQQLLQEAQQLGWLALHQRLNKIDPVAAKKIHPNDTQRIQRALEVFMLTGKPISDLQQTQQHVLPYPVIKIILSPPREVLLQRIEQRFDQMLAQGLMAEVKTLFQRDDLTATHPAMRSVGYRQVWQYLSGELNQTQMRERAIIATRQLAKRQLTWLRAETNAQWFDSLQTDLYQSVVNYVETRLKN